MMWWNGNGWWPGAFFFGAFMIMWLVMMVRMMGHGMHGSRTRESHGRSPGGGPAQILADRLARGEVDIEEYERRVAALHRTSELDRTPTAVRPGA